MIAHLAHPTLPGTRILVPDDWLLVDDVFAAQMAARDRLLTEAPSHVVCQHRSACPAASEALAFICDALADVDGYTQPNGAMRRPDGVVVQLDPDNPMGTIGHLIQEDICLLQKQGSEHILTAGVVCFPAHWTLGEKLMRPLSVIHNPVAEYDANIASRVQRLFDGIQVGRPLWRMNLNPCDTAEIHTPRSEHEPERAPILPPPYIRAERQCLVRLPKTRAMLFSIHTYMLDAARLDPQIATHLSGWFSRPDVR